MSRFVSAEIFKVITLEVCSRSQRQPKVRGREETADLWPVGPEPELLKIYWRLKSRLFEKLSFQRSESTTGLVQATIFV
jgi:hypothetical protein